MPEGRKPVAGGSWSSRFTSDQWWLLPLPLRIRWWQETEYSMRVPSSELVEAVKAALAVKGPTGDFPGDAESVPLPRRRVPEARNTEALARRSNGS